MIKRFSAVFKGAHDKTSAQEKNQFNVISSPICALYAYVAE